MHIKEKGLRINGQVRAREVRLISETNEQLGILGSYEALQKAREVGLDLVEVSPTAEPPVCRIMDYGKYLYEQKRKQREGRKKSMQHATTLKEVRLRPETDTHDLQVKLKHARDFIGKGHRVQFTVMFRGRQMLHRDRGYEILDQICKDTEDIAKVERPATMSNRRMMLVLMPK